MNAPRRPFTGPGLQGKTSYRVHDLLLEFARQKLQATGTLTDVQRVFVKILRGQCVNGEWTTTSSLSQRDYYFKYLPYHIFSSEQHSELIQLLFDFHWLEQKVKHTNLPSLISDFRFLDTPLQHEIKLLKKSLMLSADAIEKKPSSIGPQLLGRLLPYASDECPSVKKLLEDVRETCGKTCHLLPLFSCLKLEGAEIFKKNVGSPVYALATSTSSTGTIVISGLDNGSIHIHELETGKELQVLEGHTNAVSCLALSHSQRHLASGSLDNTATIWNTDTFEQLKVLQVEGGDVYALDFSTDDQRLFTGSGDGKLRVWRVTTGELLDVIPAHDNKIMSLCTTKNGLYIATASWDHTIKLWRADTLNFEATLVGHTDVVSSVVAAGNDNPMLVSASWDGTVKIWDAKKHDEIRTLSRDKGNIYSVAVSSDTKRVISGGWDRIMRLWCFHTGELLSCFEGHSNIINSLSIFSEEFKVVSGSSDGSFRVWNLDTSAHLKQDRSRGYSKSVIDIAVTHDGSRCVTASFDGFFKVWICENEEECFTLKDPKGYPVNVAISADDRYVVSLSLDRWSSSIKVWDLLDGNEITGIELDNKAELVRFCTDGRLVIIGCEDERVVIWDWQNYGKKRVVTLPSPFTTFAEIACEGNIIYTCSRNMKVCQIDLGSLEVSAVRQGPYPNCTPVVVLPERKTVLLGILYNRGLLKWELSSNDVWADEAAHSDDSIVTAIDITSNGKLALTGSSSGTLSLVNLDSHQVVETFTTTKAGVGVRLVCILSDEARFVFVDQANRVELRDFSNKEAELLLDQPAVKVTCITTLGVDYVLLGCENGELLLFNLHVKQCEYEHQAHFEAVSQVKSDAASLLHFVSGSASGCVKLWHVSKTRESGSTSQNINSLFCSLGGAKFTPLWTEVWSHDNVYPHPITALTFVPDSKDIMIGSFYGNKVHRINAAGIVRTYEFDGHRIAALRVVEDSLIAAGLSHDVCKVIKWSLNEGLVIDKFSKNWEKQYYDILRVNNASNHLASIDGNSLLIWNLKCGTMLHRLDITHDITALALVPGGEFLLSGSYRHKTLTLWDLRVGRFVEEFHFDRGVLAIACSSNGMVCVGLRGGQVCFLRFSNLSFHSRELEQ